ncbi:UPF0149 family protein [Sphingomonas sp. Tas61C01]|uniref:UPF0149 family protein n=1 Tax=Sphingomonas sp. Tas61C01 TaxID=3458297 RepID=UPI00403EF3CF
MPKLPSRLRRLDEILGDLPVDEPMLLSELDGYLTAVALCPTAIAPAEWMPGIWGGIAHEPVPFDDPIDAALFAEMVLARLAEIGRDLARDKPKPLFDIDENREAVWEEWIWGFAAAADRFLSSVDDAGPAENTALDHLFVLADIAAERSDLMSIEINALSDAAPTAIVEHLRVLAPQRAIVVAASEPVTKAGRNDPCRCGSGKKHKKCCGVA